MDEVILKVVFKYAVYKTKCVPILFLYVAIVALVYAPALKAKLEVCSFMAVNEQKR